MIAVVLVKTIVPWCEDESRIGMLVPRSRIDFVNELIAPLKLAKTVVGVDIQVV